MSTGWFASHDNQTGFFPHAESGEGAAFAVTSGFEHNSTETLWVSVRVWQQDADGSRVNETVHEVPVDPTEPECPEDPEGWHTWGMSEVSHDEKGATFRHVCETCGLTKTVRRQQGGRRTLTLT
jgi:hypothetical protein